MAILRAADVKPRPITWLWHQYLAAGKLHVLAGDAGTGKTTLALRIAADISAGRALPGSRAAGPGSVLILSYEDDFGDILIPRLIAAGADLTRVHFAESAADILTSDIPDLMLIIIDPALSIVNGSANDGQAVRQSLQPLVFLGQETGAAILGITHLSKAGKDSSVLSRVTGSLAFGALARVVWGVQPSFDGASVSVVKSNIGQTGGGVQYRITQRDGASVALWPREEQPPAPTPATSGVNISEPDDFLDEWFETGGGAHA